jgi:signal transduction histidine kinase
MFVGSAEGRRGGTMLKAAANRLMAPRWRMAALLAFVNLFVFALVWVSLESSYRQYQERAAVASRNTDRLVAQSIAGEIDRIDMGLLVVADEYARRRVAGGVDEPAEDQFLARQRQRLPMVENLLVTDARGNVLGTGLPADPATRVSIADRDYFIALRDDRSRGLVISRPVVGRIRNKWVLIFARRLDLADGGFGGVVFATVTIEWFERKFTELEVGAHGAVVMRGDASRDFDLLARFPHAGFVGQTKVSDTFRATITANPQGGTYRAYAGADDIQRTFSFQQVAGYPLITLVGLATEDYLGDWWREAVKMTVLAAVFTLVTIFGGAGMLRAWRELEQRTEELARSNADLERFAYVASHDLQTPLRTIASYAQLLVRRYKGQLGNDADDFIGFIVSGAQQMSEMIADLLNYARVSTVEQQPVPVDLARVVERVLGNLGNAIASAGAQVGIGAMPVVLAEPRQMESLFQNLIENGITYRHPDRPPRIEISAEPTTGGLWRIAVRDNGIGIEPTYHEKVFVIFQRLAPNQFPGGTGIGLALCRRIVERYGGKIWVDSVPDTGTTFLFTLPNAVPV